MYDSRSQGLDKAYLKDIIEYFDSIKEPQIIQITVEINRVKKQLEIHSTSNQQKSQYDTKVLCKIARPFFKLKKLAFEKIIQEKRIPSTNGITGATRIHTEQQSQVKNPINNSSLQANTKGCHTHKNMEEDTKSDHKKNYAVDCERMKENKNVEANRLPDKEKKVSDDIQNKHESSNINCKLTNSPIDKQIGRNADDKHLSANETINSRIKNNKLLKSVCLDNNIKNNHKTERENPRDLDHPRDNKQSISQCQQGEKERSIRFAKLFCSRSIKSSSKAKNLKRFENVIENNMHSVLPLLKGDQGLKRSMERKRKRFIDNDNDLPSALKSATIGNDRKRLKYDVMTRHLNQQ